MITVTIGTNVKKEDLIVDENTATLRTAIEQAGFSPSSRFTLDGVTVSSDDLDKTFAQKGITDMCYLLSVVKADNAF